MVQRRLLARALPSLPWLVVVVAAGIAGAGLLLGQALLLAHVLTSVFQRGWGLPQATPILLWLLLLAGLRGATAWVGEVAGERAAAAVKSRLRADVVERLAGLAPRPEGTGELAVALSTGLDALDAYVGRYLPQLVLAVAVPLLVIGWTLPRDIVSAVIMAVTVPLIPLFMALIGLQARDRTDRQWRALSILSSHFLNVIQGLPTLRLFNRTAAQETAIAQVTRQYRVAALRALRVAFLSSLTLELLATVATALVAVSIGLRLVDGGMPLEVGLAVLIATPEVYLPLRRLGGQFHAAMEALTPAEWLLQLLAEPPAGQMGGEEPVDLARDGLRLSGVAFAYPGRGELLEEVSLELRPGEKVALVGPSGSGKSTLLALILGFERPLSGAVWVGGAELSRADLASLRRQVAWLPQRPHLLAGTVADNVRFGDRAATDADVRRAARQAGLRLSLDASVGERGSRLSAGDRKRVGLARALLRKAPCLLLDEPSANLDPASEAALAEVIRGLPGSVLLAAHSPVLAAAADRVLTLAGGRLLETPRLEEAAT